jgi:hypothetical protein
MLSTQKIILAGVVMASIGGQAFGCLNDTEVAPAESEFKSGYEQPESEKGHRPLIMGMNLYGVGVLAVGVGLMALASVKVARRRA